MTTGKAWTQFEIDLITRTYAAMLRKELEGVKFNKSAIRRETVKNLDGRSEGSYELKMMNISAACKAVGLPWIKGYKADVYPNFQAALKPAIIRQCANHGIHPPLYEALTRDQLRDRLGSMCSPDPRREGYVIGPTVTGRIAHSATCFGIGEARLLAERLNAHTEAAWINHNAR